LLPLETEKVCKAIVPTVYPVLEGVVRGDCLRTGLNRHVLLPSDAEVALDGAPTHRTAVELYKTAGADARVPDNIRNLYNSY
jgi:hypothetical protein